MSCVMGPARGPPPRRTNPRLTRRGRGFRRGGGWLLLGRLGRRLGAFPLLRCSLFERQGGPPGALESLQLLAQHALLVGRQRCAFRRELLLQPVDLCLQLTGFTHPPPPGRSCSEGARAEHPPPPAGKTA